MEPILKDNGLIIAVDFDGTCVTHEYPAIGKDIGAVPVLKKLAEDGHKIILWTMRSGRELKAAAEWFEQNGIELYGINENPEQAWSTSPKAYANLYIDDAALGAPLVVNKELCDRPFIEWNSVKEYLWYMSQKDKTNVY